METAIITQKKRIKVEEMAEEEDRISALPDCLLLEILSRLPSTETAVRTGTLSKRWKYLWTSVPTLIFAYIKLPLSDFVLSVDKTLTQCCQSKLRKFELYTNYNIQYVSRVNNWIRFAISRDVEELHLSFWNFGYPAEFVLNEDFFTRSCFTDLKLSHCIFNPKGAISWKRLRSLFICNGDLNEDVIENILSGSPQLETLVLKDCYGYRRLDITSKSVNKLVLSGYGDPYDEFEFADVIEINAPNILSLTIKDHLLLRKLLMLNVSSLVEAYLNFSTMGNYDEPVEDEIELMIKGYNESTDEEAKEMYKVFMQSLCHVKKLKIMKSYLKDAYNQVMLQKNDLDPVVHPPADTELLEQSMGGSCSAGI